MRTPNRTLQNLHPQEAQECLEHLADRAQSVYDEAQQLIDSYRLPHLAAPMMIGAVNSLRRNVEALRVAAELATR